MLAIAESSHNLFAISDGRVDDVVLEAHLNYTVVNSLPIAQNSLEHTKVDCPARTTEDDLTRMSLVPEILLQLYGNRS